MATAFYDKNTWSGVSSRTGGGMRQADGVAIHHTATPNAPQSFDAGWLANVERAEMNQGYSSLAYHRMVFQDGATILGHRDWTRGTQWATACPGDSLDPRVNGIFGISAQVTYKLERAPSLGVPAPQPASQPRCVNTCSKRVLRKGSSGVCVKTLQNMLRAKGFDAGASDGNFGAKTLNAVLCFQGSAGLTQDGVVGEQTWSVLA